MIRCGYIIYTQKDACNGAETAMHYDIEKIKKKYKDKGIDKDILICPDLPIWLKLSVIHSARLHDRLIFEYFPCLPPKELVRSCTQVRECYSTRLGILVIIKECFSYIRKPKIKGMYIIRYRKDDKK